MTWRSGPWDGGMLDRLRPEVEGYFRAYYAELRRLVAEHDDSADIPDWFRGGRTDRDERLYGRGGHRSHALRSRVQDVP